MKMKTTTTTMVIMNNIRTANRIYFILSIVSTTQLKISEIFDFFLFWRRETSFIDSSRIWLSWVVYANLNQVVSKKRSKKMSPLTPHDDLPDKN